MSCVRLTLLTLLAFGSADALVRAHPVPKDSHDRTIVVRLQKTEAPNRFRVRVEYRLEVDETTVLLNDMKPFKDEVDPFDYRKEPLKYYAEFTKRYAPIYAAHLIMRVNKSDLPEPRHISRAERLIDENGEPLGHLRCDIVFENFFEVKPGEKAALFFREQNYFLEAGQIILSLVNESGLDIEKLTITDDAFRKRAMERAEPGDDDRLREIRAVLVSADTPAPVTATPMPDIEKRESHEETFSLRWLLLQTDYGLFLILILAFVFGAAHALTPGHGKTLVAAYLVGERGTIWHALFLGLVTTLTHTGSIMILAVIVALLPERLQQTFMAWIVNGLGLVMGLLVTCMGFWLLLQRATGRADHVHVGGGHHHHDEPSARNLSWWGLIVLGVTGGMVPCVDAIVLFIYTVGTSRFWLVLPAILSFSAGLALVLVVIGILVVQVPRVVESRFGDGRLLRALPMVSAILVTLMGLWLCYEGVHGK